MTRPGRTPGCTPGRSVAAVLLAVAIGGCGIPFGSPDPAAVVCNRLAAVRAAAELGPRLRQAIVARDAEAALPLAAAIRRQVEPVPQEPIEDVFPPIYWDLERALEGAMFFYGFGARAAEKGFLERPWNEGDLATALEMLARGDESAPAVEAEVRDLEANGQLSCAR